MKKCLIFFSEWIDKFARGITLFIVNAHGKCLFVSRIRPSQQFFSYITLLNDTTWWVRASDSGSGDPGSILGWIGVMFP